MDLNKKTVRTILLIITFGIAISWLFNNLNYIPGFFKNITDFLTPFLLGCGLAYILNLPTRFFERTLFGKEWKRRDNIRKRIKRPISIILALLLEIGVLVGIMLIIIPQLVNTIQTLVSSMPDSIARARAWLNKLQFDSPEITKFIDSIGYSIQELSNTATKWLSQTATTLINITLTYSVTVIRFLASFFIGLIFSIYLIMKKEQIGLQSIGFLYAVLPERFADKIRKFFTRANKAFSSFLSGQVLEAAILGTLMTFVLAIFKFPYALLIGILVGVTAIIPILGAWIGLAIGAILELTVSPRNMLYFIITFLVVQQFEGNVIYPKVVGKKVGLPAIWVLVAVTLGGSAGGILGAFLSIPLTSLVYEYLSDMVSRRLRKNKITQDKLSIQTENVRTVLVTKDDGEMHIESQTISEAEKQAVADEKAAADQKEKADIHKHTWWDQILDVLRPPHKNSDKEPKSKKDTTPQETDQKKPTGHE